MSNNDFLPSGRTSLVKRGDTALQVQTEYAHRPNPRITTCILTNGRILHKIERSLDDPVTTLEQQRSVENVIKKQHSEVIAILENQGTAPAAPAPSAPASRPAAPARPLTTQEQIAAVPGVQRVFRLNPDGTFIGSNASEQFKKMFEPVFKSLHELLEVFDRQPEPGLVRARGVYEIEQDRLYLLSIGSECDFVIVRRVDPTTDYEKVFRSIVLAIDTE